MARSIDHCVRPCRWLAVLVAVIVTSLPAARADEAARGDGRVILAHYMPWYEAKPVSAVWGWHWTMNHFKPDDVVHGRRPIASKLYPTIGPYDSADPLVIDYHLLLMKLAGIDGVIVDWYGRERHNDYAPLHRNASRLVTRAGELGLQVVVCYEDRTISELVKAGRVPADGRAAHAAKEIAWLAEHWFRLDHYLTFAGKPLLLAFGTDNLDDREWTAALQAVGTPVAYVSQAQKRSAAVGGFDWPTPSRGLQANRDFALRASQWPLSIPVAFPRFDDIYEQAHVHPSYGRIPDDDGATFSRTLEDALTSAAPIVQIATWNDWGEGTVIEPSVEFGTRDLEVVQRLRKRHLDPSFSFTKQDLDLPARLLEARRRASDSNTRDELATLVIDLASGHSADVAAKLDTLDKK